MSTMTKRDAVEAAMSLADDVAEGRLSPTDLEAQAVSELRELVGTVIGEGDPLWELQVEIARQAVGLGALSADELTEWAAVMRRRAGEPLEPSGRHDDPLPAQSSASVDESLSGSTPDANASVAAVASFAAALARIAGEASEPPAGPVDPSTAQASASEAAGQQSGGSDGDGYDPLAGFRPGATRRRH